jgi:hypothetical protein
MTLRSLTIQAYYAESSKKSPSHPLLQHNAKHLSPFPLRTDQKPLLIKQTPRTLWRFHKSTFSLIPARRLFPFE